MCQSNNCGCNFNGRIVLDTTTPQVDEFDIIGISPIVVRTYILGTKKIFEISLFNPQGPIAGLISSPGKIEFGVPSTISFSGNYSPGNSAIVSKTIDPIPSPVPDLSSSPFSFEVEVTPTQISDTFTHTITVEDANGLIATAPAGVEVQYRYYTGFVPLFDNIVDESKVSLFESVLAYDITDAFGGSREYVNAETYNQHVVWLKPTGTPDMGPVIDESTSLELVVDKEPYTITLNGAEYDIYRSYDGLGGTSTTTLNF